MKKLAIIIGFLSGSVVADDAAPGPCVPCGVERPCSFAQEHGFTELFYQDDKLFSLYTTMIAESVGNLYSALCDITGLAAKLKTPLLTMVITLFIGRRAELLGSMPPNNVHFHLKSAIEALLAAARKSGLCSHDYIKPLEDFFIM